MKARRKKESVARSTIAYVRVSTEDQATNGVSLDAQEARISGYASAMGWQVSEVIRDAGASAKSLQRAGMTCLLSSLRRKSVERVVVLKLDRLTRSTRDLADLLDVFAKHDTALVSVSESLDSSSAAGRLVVNMLGVVAQWEREVIAERTASALAHKRQQGLVYGPTPYGFRRHGQSLVTNVEEQAILHDMRRQDAAGWSFRAIAAALEARGVRAPKGGQRWHASSVRSVLRSQARS